MSRSCVLGLKLGLKLGLEFGREMFLVMSRSCVFE